MYRSSLLLALLGLLGAGGSAAQTRIITGRVSDSLTAEPVSSGQVTVQGTTIGAAVRDDGTFTLAVPPRDVTISIRSIGFRRRDISVPASQNSVDVALARDYFQLEAIVVTGQATGVEKRNLANAVATVTADQLTKAPAATVEQQLQGKISGANISQNSGAPGGGMMVRLRGVTSIIGTFTPLYVVDGVIVSDAAIFNGTNFLRRAFGASGIAGNQDNPVNRIADLNPNDIESVEVLKGASASAIYGSKASNGVIIISTKKGRVGAPQFTLSQRLGVSKVNPRALIGSRIFASAAEATAIYGAGAAADFNAAGGNVFDNEMFLVGNTGFSHETNASVSGGTESTRYYASGLVKHDGGIVRGTFADKQSMRLNVDQTIGRRLTMGLSTEAIHTAADRGLTNNENSGVSWYSSLSVTPSFFDLRGKCGGQPTTKTRCSDGSVPIYPVNPYGSSNPLQSTALLQNREAVWRILMNARASLDAVVTPQHTLRFLGTAGGDIFTQKNAVYSPPELQFEDDDGFLGTSVLSFSQSQNFNVNANAVYTYRTAGGTSATTQAGIQYETRNLNIARTMAENLVGGLQNIRNATFYRFIEQDLQLVKDFGLFAQEEFLTLGEKLLLTVGVRADQSSNNGDPDKLFSYPKASASYRLGIAPGAVDEIKFRAALGYSGNQPKYGQKFTELVAGNIAGIPTARLNLAGGGGGTALTGDPGIKPERQREIEGGFDATLFGSRGNLEATVYEKRISDLLLTRTLAPTTGFGIQLFNGGVMRTRGLELATSVFPVQNPTVQWNVRGTFFMSRCTILDLRDPAGNALPAFRPITFLNSSTFGSTFIEPGKSCTQLVGNEIVGGTGQTQIGGTRQQFQVLTRPGGKAVEANPDYRLSLSNDLTYKRVRLYFLWDREKGGALLNATGFLYDLSGTSPDQTATTPQANCPKKHLCAGWKTAQSGTGNGLTGAERAGMFNRGKTELFLEDKSYLKLRELTITYEVPTAAVRKFWSNARFVRIGLSGRNLLTFTPFRGADPENNEIQRSAAEGVPWEIWAYPPSRSLWFNIDVGF
ncbi:MAG: SusC/RagA family TonB-linked outer membrane protein [Gemmatimonadetes bacterium]|nr:SusC/RagA family TonB-linked outer membrane protein [Gemmatimonadota bacterium]